MTQGKTVEQLLNEGYSPDEIAQMASARRPATESEDETEEHVVTKKDLDKAMQKMRIDARVEAMTLAQQRRMKDTVRGVVTSAKGFEDITTDELAVIESRAARRLREDPNVKPETMDDDQWNAALRNATAEVVKEQRSLAAKRAGLDPTAEAELESRLNAQATTGDVGSLGGPTDKSSSDDGGEGGALEGDDHMPRFGLLSDKRAYPTQMELDELHERELDSALKTMGKTE